MTKQTKFKTKFFVNNRREFRKKLEGVELCVIAANGQLQKSLDAVYPFRQDSNFWYLTGLDEPSVLLVIDREGEYLILPEQSEYIRIFDGEIDKESISKSTGINEILDFDEGWEKLKTRIKKITKIGILSPPESYIQPLNMFVNPARADIQKKLLDIKPKLNFSDVKQHIIQLRAIKQPEEILAIKNATKITISAFIEAGEGLEMAKSEKDLERIFSKQFLKVDADHAFSPIVASGANATVLHYISNNSKLAKKQMVLIDAGATKDMYSADITRTIARNPTARQLDVHKKVQDVLESLTKKIKPGMSLRDFEKTSRELMAEKLVQLGLIKSAADEKYREYYPHATSHHVGLDVHDPIPSDTVLQAGMVLTIEPGIYIKEESIGVRIEDLVLISESGCEVLSGSLSHDIDLHTIVS